MLKVFILLSPFSFICLINSSTSWFFKSWYKSFISLLFLQSFVAIVLLVTFSFDFSKTDFVSKLLCVGSIYALTKSNIYIRELIGGITTEVSNGFSNLSRLISKK